VEIALDQDDVVVEDQEAGDVVLPEIVLV